MRLTDAIFARMVVDVRSILAALPSEQKADLDGEFLTPIAEQPNEILKGAMYLFLGNLDGATQFRPVLRRRWQRQLANLGPQGRRNRPPLRLPLHDAGSSNDETLSPQTRFRRPVIICSY